MAAEINRIMAADINRTIPVRMMSPASRVITADTARINAGILNVMSDVFPSCFRVPFTSHLRNVTMEACHIGLHFENESHTQARNYQKSAYWEQYQSLTLLGSGTLSFGKKSPTGQNVS
jgi:hypothetical protein